jgi:hypothetical protein
MPVPVFRDTKARLEEALNLIRPKETEFQRQAQEMSFEELFALPPGEERSKIAKEKIRKGFAPLGLLARSPQALAGRLALRTLSGLPAAAEEAGVAEGVAEVEALDSAAGESIETFEEFAREVGELSEAPPNIARAELKKKLLQEAANRAGDVPAKSLGDELIKRKAAELSEEALKEMEKAAREKVGEQIETIAVKGASELARAVINRSSGNQRFRDRKAEAEERGEAAPKRGLITQVTEQAVPGSRFASEEGGLSTRLIAFGTRGKKGKGKK